MCEPAGLSNVGVAFRLRRFSVQYRKRLIDGLKNLQKYCRLVHGRTIEAVVSKPKTVDILLGEYVLYRFNESNKGLSVVKHALLACQHVYPHLKGKLQVSWSNLKTWEEQRVSAFKTSHSGANLVAGPEIGESTCKAGDQPKESFGLENFWSALGDWIAMHVTPRGIAEPHPFRCVITRVFCYV